MVGKLGDCEQSKGGDSVRSATDNRYVKAEASGIFDKIKQTRYNVSQVT